MFVMNRLKTKKMDWCERVCAVILDWEGNIPANNRTNTRQCENEFLRSSIK
jgi:hypothetical protein